MENKYFHWGDYHVFRCEICFDMEQRGYEDEGEYWDDLFKRKLKPVTYKLYKSIRIRYPEI